MNTAKTSARDFFLHLGVMVTLYVSSISLLTLVFEVINLSFPDQLDSRYFVDPYSTGIRWAIASLFIMFPLYILLSWILGRDYRLMPEKRELWVRKWLIYITLFVAGLALAIDLITLVNYFLGGEITTRFILKVLSVLVVAAGIFTYYLQEVRQTLATNRGRLAGGFAIVLVLAAIIGGFAIMGSPYTVRLLRFDHQKISDLGQIQWKITNYWQDKGTMPADLAALNDSLGTNFVPTDPQTGAAYTYAVTGEHAFKLCANFNRPSGGLNSNGATTRPILPNDENWTHAAGQVCFDRTIDTAVYPVIPTRK